MLNGSDRFAPLDILVSILDLRNSFVFPSIFQYITLSCLHQPPHTTLVVFYVSIPPFPCLPPLVSCLNHQVCFSSFFFFFSTLWFRSMLRKWQTVSSTGGEGGEKKRVCGWFLDPAGPSRHPLHQMGLADCTGLTPTTSSFVLIVWISLLSVHGHNKKWEWGQN